jgi:hypothetical protein
VRKEHTDPHPQLTSVGAAEGNIVGSVVGAAEGVYNKENETKKQLVSTALFFTCEKGTR